MRRTTTNTTKRVIGLFGVTLLAAGLLVNGPSLAAPAQAVDADLPTWDDVQSAKQNQASTAAKTKEIEGLIADGEKELDRLRNLHSTTITELQAAEEALAAAADKAQVLETQASESREEADAAAERASVIVAQMYRSGGVDRSMELFLETEADTADALLERLASMSKATERNSQISQEAEQAANTAASLGKQAEVAQQEREKLRQDKQEKEAAAQQAVSTQGELVAAQESQQRELEAQLAALKDTTAKTVEGYEERLRQEEADRKAEEERLAREAAERAQREAEERARQQEQNQNNGGGGDGGGDGGTTPVTPPNPTTPTTSGGWVIPTTGYYVSEGFRPPGRPDHTGIDLATACWTPIIAAQSGTVALAYWDSGGGGNMVSINHDNGWQTRYAHMVQWASVGAGQRVNAGDVVGYVGTTGMSTGCHLHFEMRMNQDNGWYGFENPAYYINF